MAGESLFDTLAGGFGHAVNRPALEAFVANSQANNGLRTAQTDVAIGNAQKQQEEFDAHNQIEAGLGSLTSADGKPIYTPSETKLVKNLLISHFGNAPEVIKALQEGQTFANQRVLSDPTQLGTPGATAAAQGNTNKVPEVAAAPEEYVVPPGMPTPTIHQTPLGQAKTESYGATADLKGMQAAHPELFHVANGQQLTPEQAQDVADFVRLNPAAASNVGALVRNGAVSAVSALMHPERAGGAAAPAGGVAPVAGAPASGVAPPNGVTPAAGLSFKEQADIRHDFASGVGARQTTALNTMDQHARLFDLIADQLNNGNFTPTNAIGNLWAKTFGSPAPSNLATVGSFLGREAIRATVNSGAGTGQERELQVGPNDSPASLHGAAQTLRSLAAGQLHSLARRAQRGGVDITQLLDPEAVADYGFAPQQDAAHGAGSAGVVNPPNVSAAGGAQPATSAGADQAAARGTPTYHTEAEAEAAAAAGSLKPGTKIIVNGVSGTWH
jgi:hypothetical protein